MARPVINSLRVALALALLASPVLAGDRAALDIIGYSQDGRYFAFEEFGVQDGSGFAYATIFLIDLESDSWVAGTPVRVRADSEERPLHTIRAEAQGQFAQYAARFALDQPGELIAMIGDGVPDNDGTTLAFGAVGFTGPGSVQGHNVLALESFAVPASPDCASWTDSEIKGFALSITSGDITTQLHRDARLPASRGCALDYRLHGVAVPFPGWSLAGGVALVSVYSLGFEGPDRRFLAVPLGQ